MFTIIFEVTDQNEIVGLIPESGEVWLNKISKEDAAFYRRDLKKEIMIRRYFNKIPGEIIGRYISINFSPETIDKFFSLNQQQVFFHIDKSEH